ncbi:MAG: TonB-dependent receptor [Bacteroidales bacterium]|nr:TonB-dependent receptor [Bacteroidales bacterium]
MKFTSRLVALFAFVLISVTAWGQKVTLRCTGEPLKAVLSEIQKQTDYQFVYNNSLVDVTVPVTVNLSGAEINEAMNQVLSGASLGWRIVDKQISIFPLEAQNSQPRNRAVSGVVTDSSGEPLPGAYVYEKGTQNGTVTDNQGRYTLNVPRGSSIIVSLLGFNDIEIPVGQNAEINTSLVESTEFLDEAVAIGYGTVKKRDLTGSISSISTSDFRAQPVTGTTDMLRGRVAGLTFTQTSADVADGGAKIRIRGNNSLFGSNSPLTIVDGVPYGIYNPNDVESIEVLKDASATAIYGSRGANGVIIITTKRGRSQEPVVEVKAQVSAAKQAKFYDLLSGPEFGKFYNSYFGTDIPFDNSIDTDWQREVTQTGIRQLYQANVSGGGKAANFYVSAGYSNNTGTVKNNWARGYNVKSNLDFKLGDKFTSRIDMALNYGVNHNGGVNTGKSTLLYALEWSPNVAPYGEDSTYNTVDPYSTTAPNPLLSALEENRNNYSLSGIANAYLAYEIIPGLTVSVQPSVNIGLSEHRRFDSHYLGTVEAQRTQSHGVTWEVTGLLNYERTFAEKHNMNLMLGTEWYNSEGNWFYADGKNQSDERQLWYNLAGAPDRLIASGYSNEALESFFARANYNYDGKYYVTASIRADGASKFKKENHFSYFPSAAVGWVVSKEEFMQGIDWIDFLKLRASYGATGSQAISPYSTIAALSTFNYGWGVEPKSQQVYLGDPVNSSLKWEVTKQYDFGVNFHFLNKFTLDVDYWNKLTSDMLTDQQLGAYDGGGSVKVNLGEMQNKGIDIALGYTPFSSKDFSWTMTWTGSFLKNKVKSLGGMGDFFPDDANLTGVQLETSPVIVQEGQSLGNFYGYKWLGLWGTDELNTATGYYGQKPGDNRYEDVNGDHVIDSNDMQVIGNFLPKFTWGYSTTIYWKDFDFNLVLDGAHGQDMLNLNKMLASTVVGSSTSILLREAAENIWSPSNQDSRYSPFSGSAQDRANSSKWIEKAGWVKVRNISIGYTIPRKVLGKHSIRLSASVQNAFTFTGYSGYDPETADNASRSDMVGGIEYGCYAVPRIFTFGINYKFN